MLKIIPCDKANQKKALDFLERYQETALFLLSNLVNFGPKTTDHIYSGNYKILTKEDEIVAVFYLAKSGTILLQTDKAQNYSEIILSTCIEENRPITNVIGAWDDAKSLWNLLQFSFPRLYSTREQNDFLYRFDLNQIDKSQHKQIRFLNAEDFETWKAFQKDYLRSLDLPEEDSSPKIFLSEVAKKHWWGLFIDKELISVAALNATYKKLGQVGGVYTKPDARGLGFSTQLMKQLISDSRHVHYLDTLILFTGENNIAAQTVYQKVGFERIGDFGLFFGKIQ